MKGSHASPKYYRVDEEKMDGCQESQLDKWHLLSALSIFQFLVLSVEIYPAV